MSERIAYFVEASGIEFSGPHDYLTGKEGALDSVEHSRKLLKTLKGSANLSSRAPEKYQTMIDNLTIRVEPTIGEQEQYQDIDFWDEG